MFGLSFGELFIIGVVGLIVIGPERLPTVARTLGHLVGRAQRYVTDVKSDIQREMDIQEIAKIRDEMQSAVSDVKSSVEDTASALRNPVNALRDDLIKTGDSLRDTVSGGADTGSAASDTRVSSETSDEVPVADEIAMDTGNTISSSAGSSQDMAASKSEHAEGAANAGAGQAGTQAATRPAADRGVEPLREPPVEPGSQAVASTVEPLSEPPIESSGPAGSGGNMANPAVQDAVSAPHSADKPATLAATDTKQDKTETPTSAAPRSDTQS